eukprot:c19905_g1_i1 orf=576-1673(-)
MKRFFQAVERDGSCKKLPSSGFLNDGSSLSASFGCLPSSEGVIDPQISKGPLKLMSWNANSLILRIKNNLEELTSLLQRLDPDVIAIQEVRIPAAGRKGEQRNQGEMKDDTSAARDDKQSMMNALSTYPLKNYRVWWSLGDTKYAGTALFVKNCFKPLNIFFSLDKSDAKFPKHETDGRVILAEFDSFHLLNTYVPNNGWKEEEFGFLRRRKWDRRITEFVSQTFDKPLIWCGDLNVSHQDIDVSHPEFFSSAKLQGYIPPNSEDRGQPGYTLSERRCFSDMLAQGDLVDSYRWLHKEKDMDRGFTWSGHPVGKYRGKRMRIDYFLVSKKLLPRVIKSEIHGHGIEMEGFCGSDHCPISMELAPG